MSVNIIPLSELGGEVPAVLEPFDADRVPVVRLMAMGLRPGDEITVLARTSPGEPIVVCRGPMRIVLDARLKGLLSVSPRP